MVQVHANLGFIDEERDKARVSGVLGPDSLDHQPFLKARDAERASQEHFGHATRADLLE
jgi:hypothetical protein